VNDLLSVDNSNSTDFVNTDNTDSDIVYSDDVNTCNVQIVVQARTGRIVRKPSRYDDRHFVTL